MFSSAGKKEKEKIERLIDEKLFRLPRRPCQQCDRRLKNSARDTLYAPREGKTIVGMIEDFVKILQDDPSALDELVLVIDSYRAANAAAGSSKEKDTTAE